MPERFRVVVSDYLADADLERSVLGEVADLICLQAADEQTVLARQPDADVLLVFHDIRFSGATLPEFRRLRGVVRVGVGFDNVDLTAAGANGIIVCNVPDYGTEDVADHALLMLLATGRRLMACVDSIRQGEWNPIVLRGAPRLRGRTLGILGCGRIGTAMALRAKALGMAVVFYDPYLPPGYEKALGVERGYRLAEVLAQAEFVSLHCPLTAETRHLLNYETLALLPRGAYVINTARGPCIDPEALLAALESGQLAGAALDVLETEPLTDERLRHHPRLLVTPHVAYYSVEGFVEMRVKAAEEARRMLTGEPVRNPVNVQVMTGQPRSVLPPALGSAPILFRN